MKNSVRLIDKEIATKLEQATKPQLRTIAKTVCRFVLEENQLLLTPAIVRGIASLDKGEYSFSPELTLLLAELDEIQWTLGEDAQSNPDLNTAYLEAFQRARAVNTLQAALDPDPRVAAAEFIYEAYFATQQHDEFRKIVMDILEL